MIAREVRRAGLIDILGITGHQNIHGEKVQKLDEYGQDLIYKSMLAGHHVCCMASEERAEMMTIPRDHQGGYVLMYDPLDGSSNIDVNISIGTIFSIHKKVSAGPEGALEDCLQQGLKHRAVDELHLGEIHHDRVTGRLGALERAAKLRRRRDVVLAVKGDHLEVALPVDLDRPDRRGVLLSWTHSRRRQGRRRLTAQPR